MANMNVYYVYIFQLAHIRKLEAENQEAATRLENVVARGKLFHCNICIAYDVCVCAKL